ncbi:glycosyltransferase family 4 protein [Candidatus Uhrbacteria bacterium]|nr:glycosyltransferase family 4 protein [Candidatus Uhrbacteria bacterium]
MRIGIDARMMTPKATRGIGRYVEELVRALLAVAPEHRYVLVTRQPIHPFSTHPSVETIVADVPWYGVREQVNMPGVFRKIGCDVIHIPHWNVPVAYSGPLVVTIHDLLLRHEPASARISTRGPLIATIKRAGYRWTIAAALAHAKKILVPTAFVADDLRTLYPGVAPKIVITGEGMGRKTAPSPLRSSAPPSSDYLLYVGSAYPHKGLDLLLDAWAELEMRHPSLHLKIAGADDEFMRRTRIAVQRRGLPRIEFLGYVDDAQLTGLYREALALVFPSRFEGFGLPPLEAIQAGCPVVSSDAAALPETLGPDAAFFFQSGSRTAILGAIERVLQDPNAAREMAMSALPGLQARHDWAAAAKRTLAVYESVVGMT